MASSPASPGICAPYTQGRSPERRGPVRDLGNGPRARGDGPSAAHCAAVYGKCSPAHAGMVPAKASPRSSRSSRAGMLSRDHSACAGSAFD